MEVVEVDGMVVDPLRAREQIAQYSRIGWNGHLPAVSANNGNFWVVAPSNTKTLTWSGAGVRLRNANGDAPMMSTAAAGCNASACHKGTLKMTSP
jgi:hypothetical protein